MSEPEQKRGGRLEVTTSFCKAPILLLPSRGLTSVAKLSALPYMSMFSIALLFLRVRSTAIPRAAAISSAKEALLTITRPV